MLGGFIEVQDAKISISMPKYLIMSYPFAFMGFAFMNVVILVLFKFPVVLIFSYFCVLTSKVWQKKINANEYKMRHNHKHCSDMDEFRYKN